jgi:hypothetical protein
MWFRRRRGGSGSPEVEANRRAIAQGWDELRWGASSTEFLKRFPHGTRTDSGWWVTGEGHDQFLGIAMLTQYSFNAHDQLCLVAFYPETKDRVRLPAAMLSGLGAPVGDDTRWTIGDVTVDLKVASVAATLTHRALAAVGS